MERIDGRTAAVTGAASGIGLAITDALVASGAQVAMLDVDDAALAAAASRFGSAVITHHLDVADRDGWSAVRDHVEVRLGPVEILVNNAGIGPDLNPLIAMPPATFDRMVAIKLTGTFNGIQTFGPGMRDRGEGHIVNTASMAGVIANAKLGAYTAAMFGVVGISEVLRAEMARHGVGVSVLCPGLVRTNLAANTPSEHAPTRTPSGGDMADGIDSSLVGAQVLDAIRADALYVITHGELAPLVAARTEALHAAFDAAPRRR